MNKFVVTSTRPLSPAQVVLGVMGITLDDLVNAIRENRDGQFDHLYAPCEKAEGCRIQSSEGVSA